MPMTGGGRTVFVVTAGATDTGVEIGDGDGCGVDLTSNKNRKILFRT